MTKTILVTGGAGYIGSHIVAELCANGYDVAITDNFSNSERGIEQRIAEITGKTPVVYNCDVAQAGDLRRVFEAHTIGGVIHCAGYKAVGESVAKPLMYYRNNLGCTVALLEVMQEFKVRNLVFSSSATVYGVQDSPAYHEEMAVGVCVNPYGATKLYSEQIIRDFAASEPNFSAVLLRYFNPVGAHPSGLIGEMPSGIPNNLMPYITQVAAGKLARLSVFGNDYPTRDGTGVRDYIHVCDLASGHLAALEYTEKHSGAEVFNLGTGKGYSVLELVETFIRVNDVAVPYVIAERRAGDLAEYYADAGKAKTVLGWEAKLGLEAMCRDSWRWAKSVASGV